MESILKFDQISKFICCVCKHRVVDVKGQIDRFEFIKIHNVWYACISCIGKVDYTKSKFSSVTFYDEYGNICESDCDCSQCTICHSCKHSLAYCECEYYKGK